MEDYNNRHTDGDGGYHPHDRRTRFGFSNHGHGVEHVITKIEKYVHSVEKSIHSAFDHRHQMRLASMELDHNPKAPQGGKVAYRADEEARPRFKIAKWKYYDLGNKLGHKHDSKADMEKKEPPAPPAMISTGGWIRPNRAMWASPPNGSANNLVGSDSEPELYSIGHALDHLKEAGGRTGYSDSRSGVSVKPRSDVNHLPKDVRERLDHMRKLGAAKTGNSGYRFSVAIPVRK